MSSLTFVRGEIRIKDEKLTKDIRFGLEQLIKKEYQMRDYFIAPEEVLNENDGIYIVFDARGRNTFKNNAAQFFNWLEKPEEYHALLVAIALNQLKITFEFKEYNTSHGEMSKTINETIMNITLDKNTYLKHHAFKTLTEILYETKYQPDVEDLDDLCYADPQNYSTKAELDDHHWIYNFHDQEEYQEWLNDLGPHVYNREKDIFETENGEPLVVNPQECHFVLENRPKTQRLSLEK